MRTCSPGTGAEVELIRQISVAGQLTVARALLKLRDVAQELIDTRKLSDHPIPADQARAGHDT
ncbi:hypothetical protein ACFVWG_20260 [Kribbella sp. NPDC058245]|uniref:hypothetical protein n=1 Tax=Kribbella sp. NPDC058245 TaxID=3346399 RepID=UPI0036E0FFE2